MVSYDNLGVLDMCLDSALTFFLEIPKALDLCFTTSILHSDSSTQTKLKLKAQIIQELNIGHSIEFILACWDLQTQWKSIICMWHNM